MDDASVEPRRRSFSDATCQRLTQLLLRCASLDVHSELPQWVVEEVASLRRSDASFAGWCEQHVPKLGESLTIALSGETPLRSAALAYDLPRQLVRVRDWQGEESAAILVDTAHLALRLHGFESQFARELDARLQQTLYHFAYGLSHELNNPLANIATRAGVLAQAETNQQRLSMLQTIVDNAMRGCEMLGDLMLVARPPRIERQAVSIAAFLEAFVEKGRKWVEPCGVTLELEIQPWPAQLQPHFDPSAMTETLWVLVRNGVEAMPQGGRLTICSSWRCDSIHCGSARSNSENDVRPVLVQSECGAVVWWIIELVDEGVGMSPLALRHCFDPYYSGREAGRGLGVGLTKAQRLVALHHGRLTIANRTDRQGARAVIELPIAESDSPECP